MTNYLKLLAGTRRYILEASLVPMAGRRFQPTGFPDLGAATFQSGNSLCLLVESAQSMANRLEGTIWDEANQDLTSDAEGLSYVRVLRGSEYLTSSIQEAHRLSSPYILEEKKSDTVQAIRNELNVPKGTPIDRRKLAATLFKYDVNSLLHGVFLANSDLAGGRLRIARSLSAFVEATGVRSASSGGVKNDHVHPQGNAADRFGNVPFSREEFTADEIKAYFTVDVQQLRAFGLPDEGTELLLILALYKIRSLLEGDLRFRTSCDLQLDGEGDTALCERFAPSGSSFTLPGIEELATALRASIIANRDSMEQASVEFTAPFKSKRDSKDAEDE